MAFQRRPAIPFPDAPWGACRWCGDSILQTHGPDRGERNLRRRWHPPCLAAYQQSDPREARRRVLRRDRGRCATCGLDTNAQGRRLRGRDITRRLRGLRFRRRLRDLRFMRRKPLWEVDQIVPLVDGGTHDLANLQTLCTPCHTLKTAREVSERRAREQQRQSEALVERAELLLDASRRLVGHLRDAAAEIVGQHEDAPRLPSPNLSRQIDREGET